MRYRAPWGTSVAVLTGLVVGGVAVWTVIAILKSTGIVFRRTR